MYDNMDKLLSQWAKRSAKQAPTHKCNRCKSYYRSASNHTCKVKAIIKNKGRYLVW
jgi:hypothetical protein